MAKVASQRNKKYEYAIKGKKIKTHILFQMARYPKGTRGVNNKN